MKFFEHRFNLTVFDSLPIPPLKSPDGWRNVKIHDCGEKLVRLSTLHPDRIVVDSRYYKEGYPDAITECYVRENVALLLREASEALPPSWKIIIFDAWRPLILQQQLFKRYKAQLRSKYPEESEQKLNQEALKYVSLPSSNPVSPSPHVTGGAVDLSLRDETGTNLDMGTEFDAFNEKAYTRYYELKLERDGKLPPQELTWLKNRRILFHTLIRVGFINYPEEWWHFDYGNQFWARIKEVEAIYGIISLNEDRS